MGIQRERVRSPVFAKDGSFEAPPERAPVSLGRSLAASDHPVRQLAVWKPVFALHCVGVFQLCGTPTKLESAALMTGSMHRERALPDSSVLVSTLLRYREANHARSMFELGITVGSLALLWVLMRLSLDVGYWLTLLLSLPAAGFLVRLFLIQHDCGHGAFFRHKFANDWIGRTLGVLTLTPYDYWKRNHAIHHASSSNLDRRGIGDIETLTVEEYQSRSWLGRCAYRIYRNPLIMFGVGPAYLFLLQHRIPLNQMQAGWKPWVSTMATNVAIILAIVCMAWVVGVQPFLLVHVPITLLAASIGVWLFYVQHQFENVAWTREDGWTLHESALTGSSHYHLPGILRWFTANIGVHHVHHLNSRIPFYKLPKVLRDHPELKEISQLTLFQSLRGARLALWDETRQKLISFREMADRKDN